MTGSCVICDKPVPNYDPMMCCSGYQCDCRGMPTNPCICSNDCWDELMKPQERKIKLLLGEGGVKAIERADVLINHFQKKLDGTLTEADFISPEAAADLNSWIVDEFPPLLVEKVINGFTLDNVFSGMTLVGTPIDFPNPFAELLK